MSRLELTVRENNPWYREGMQLFAYHLDGSLKFNVEEEQYCRE